MNTDTQNKNLLYTYSTKKVLLVEDDTFISDMIVTKLNQTGFEVERTADGKSVMRALEETNPDILLLDLMLPNKHGFEVLQEIREVDAYKDLPVVILSNENGSDVETKAKNLGAYYYFKAMTDISQLTVIINTALGE